MPDPSNLSATQRRALILTEGSGPAVITTGKTGLYDGEAFVHWRTAQSLHDRGLAAIRPPLPDPEARLHV